MKKFGFNKSYSGIELNKDRKMAHLIYPLSIRSERKFIYPKFLSEVVRHQLN